jgi:hypothetical protein
VPPPFPGDDPVWTEAAVHVRERLEPGDVIFAPAEFRQVLPGEVRPMPGGAAVDRAVGEGDDDGDWVVVHKGRLGTIDPGWLDGVTDSMRPVFANAVFVVFSKRAEAGVIDESDPHYAAFVAMRLQAHRGRAAVGSGQSPPGPERPRGRGGAARARRRRRREKAS